MFGRRPKLPLDLILGDEKEEIVSQTEYVKKWEQQMKEAYQIVKEKSGKRKQKDIERRRGDGKKILGDLTVGERVLVKNMREKGGPGKLRSYWEQKVFIVIEKKSEVVYSVLEEGENNLKKARVLHRNMLLPVSQWFELEKPTKCLKRKEEKVNKPRKEKQKEIRENCEAANGQKEVDSEEENKEMVCFLPIIHRKSSISRRC